MQTLLLVGVGRMGRPYVAAARRLGARVHAVEIAERAEPIVDLVDDVTICRGWPDELWLEAVWAAVRRHRPDGVLAFSEPHVMAAALLQDELGLPGPSLRAAVLSRNKALQRARYGAVGIGQPDYFVTERLADAAEWASTRMPVVVKPLSEAGSAGVELVPGAERFDDVVERRGHEGRLLVEREATGPEYSWEALVRDGSVWFANLTAKETTGPPHYIEIAHRTAADVDPATEKLAFDLGTSVVEALGVRTAMVHLEFRLSAGGPSVMEVAVRTPGDYLMDLLGLTYGVDWFELVVRGALGRDLPAPPTEPLRYAASYLPVATPGTVRAVEGLAEVQAHPNVVSATVTVAPGDSIPVPQWSGHRVAEVILSAGSREELEEALGAVRSTLRFHIVPDAP